MTFDQLVQKVDDLSSTISQNNANIQFVITVSLTILGILVAFGGPQFIKYVVDKKVNEELDNKLLHLLEVNPPFFYATGTKKPDEYNRIYLDVNTPGLNQLSPSSEIFVNVISLSDYSQKVSTRVTGFIELDDNKYPYIHVGIHQNQDEMMDYNVMWRRTKLVKK